MDTLTWICVAVIVLCAVYIALALLAPRCVGFKRCPRHGWVMAFRDTTCPICAASGWRTDVR